MHRTMKSRCRWNCTQQWNRLRHSSLCISDQQVQLKKQVVRNQVLLGSPICEINWMKSDRSPSTMLTINITSKMVQIYVVVIAGKVVMQGKVVMMCQAVVSGDQLQLRQYRRTHHMCHHGRKHLLHLWLDEHIHQCSVHGQWRCHATIHQLLGCQRFMCIHHKMHKFARSAQEANTSYTDAKRCWIQVCKTNGFGHSVQEYVWIVWSEVTLHSHAWM